MNTFLSDSTDEPFDLSNHSDSAYAVSHRRSPLTVDSIAESSQSGRHLVFIDAAVDNIDQLIEGISSASVVVLDENQNGIEQITQVLADYAAAADMDALIGAPYGGGLLDGVIPERGLLESVHVISHGDRAALTLGNTTLNAENISDYEADLNQWRDALDLNADILFYGCEVADGELGQQFIRRISELTGADIAASNDLTGAEGDWDLEVSKGEIEAQLAIDSATQIAYEGALANYNGKEYALTDGYKTWETAQAEARNIGGNLVTINSAAEEQWLKQTFGDSETFWIGLSDRVQEGQFEWASGEAVTYTNWDPNEPNNFGGNEDYATMNFSWRKQWNDDSGGKYYRGIIEIEEDTPPSPPNPPNPPQTPGGIALETNLLSVSENAGEINVKIIRTQGSDGSVTVDYRTADDSAQEGSDYRRRRGTVTFNSGQTERTIRVPIINDSRAEGAELFNFTIDNVQGGASLLAPRTAQITIDDDDAPPPPPPPSDNTFRGNRYLLTDSAKPWEAAQTEAQQKGGNLVTINSAEEEAWLKQTFGADDNFWIGLTDKASEGQFRWTSGEPVTYTNWDPDEPNNYGGGEDYTTMNFSWRKQWNDDSGSRSFRGIIEIGGNNTPPGTPNPPNPPATTPTKETLYSGLSAPTAVEWTPDSSKLFIAEKGGVVKVAENGTVLPTNFIDIFSQVNAANDRGLLDIAIHPNFPSTPYVYLLYTYDPPEVNGSPGLGGPDQPGNRAGRLTRVTADASTGYKTAVPGSEVVLLGKNSTWENFNGFTDSTFDFNEPPAGIRPDGTNIPDFLAADSQSHSIGSVEFGQDGALYVSNGDGTSYNRPDPRSERVQDINNLSGKILRIDPITGKGLGSNPFFNGNAGANRSKVYQLGLRNPFRFAISPSTGRPVIGDVGWKTWEEINVAGAGANFGWPYFEGDFQTNEYKDLPSAQDFYSRNPNVIDPSLALNHNTGINAIIMGDIYDGNAFPDRYQGDVFFNDVGQGIVSHADIDSAGNISNVAVFARDSTYVVQMNVGPDGNLYYVDLDDGTIGRWTFG